MEKEKPTPWEGKKKMFKDGDPNVFRGFNWQTWNNMTEGERAMWTEFSEVARAPIPKEVIDFKEGIKDRTDKARGLDKETLKEKEDKQAADFYHKAAGENAIVPKAKILSDEGYPITLTEDKYVDDDRPDIEDLSKEYLNSLPIGHLTEEEQKDIIKVKLKERGIRFTHNSKLETLQKKLADADNTE